MSNRVSESEYKVMEVLWQESPLSSGEVVARLQQTDWTEKTVKSFLNRLVKKQVVSFTRDGRRYLYSPAVARDQVLGEESSSLLNRVFNGDIKQLLATFVQNKQLSQEELDYLKGLLDEEHNDA